MTIDLPDYLHALHRHPRVRVVQSTNDFFCKASLLNQGLSLAASDFALISDADILWTEDGLRDLINAVEEGGREFAWVKTMVESEPLEARPSDIEHRRLGFRVTKSAPNMARVELFEDDSSSNVRPGYGLIYGACSTFRKVGGYKTGWGGGWGWEDVDIIIRAGLLGLSLEARSSAVHLTHNDELRALNGTSKITSRDHNINLSRRDICAGRLQGALGDPMAVSDVTVVWQDCRDEIVSASQ